MNQERQKTDAIADAVEIPEGATHTNQSGYYFKNIYGTDCDMYNPHDQRWFSTYVSIHDQFKPL